MERWSNGPSELPFQPAAPASLADMQCGIGRLAEQRIARRLDRPHQPTFSHEGCGGAGGFADNSIMTQSSPKNPTVTFHAIELDDFDSSYFANCDRSGRSPGSCSDRPCQYLYQSQSSLIARNRSRYPSSRNLYSSRAVLLSTRRAPLAPTREQRAIR